ncbi:MAG: flagellar FliJ family protein [Proteobacteria bacterium]|nr:flagellar FliJ family protein [Pseudomonadota bacterium]
MANDLHTLIRLNEWTVDQRRRELGEVLASLASLEAGLKRLREELIKEQSVVRSSPEEAGFFYGNYAAAVIIRREDLNQGILRMEEQVAEAREKLNEAYRDLKKYEIAQESRDAREARELARREQEILNELGLQAYRLKQRRSATS